MLTSIAGRSVIVTGASKGIGKGIATVFCRNGGKVLVVSRDLPEAEACAAELRRAGETATPCAADVTKIQYAPGTHHGLLLVRLPQPGRSALAERVSSLFRTEAVETWKGCVVSATPRKVRVKRTV